MVPVIEHVTLERPHQAGPDSDLVEKVLVLRIAMSRATREADDAANADNRVFNISDHRVRWAVVSTARVPWYKPDPKTDYLMRLTVKERTALLLHAQLRQAEEELATVRVFGAREAVPPAVAVPASGAVNRH